MPAHMKFLTEIPETPTARSFKKHEKHFFFQWLDLLNCIFLLPSNWKKIHVLLQRELYQNLRDFCNPQAMASGSALTSRPYFNMLSWYKINSYRNLCVEGLFVCGLVWVNDVQGIALSLQYLVNRHAEWINQNFVRDHGMLPGSWSVNVPTLRLSESTF